MQVHSATSSSSDSAPATQANSAPATQASSAPAVGVYRQACSGIPLEVGFVGRDRRLWNSMVQGTQRFRQTRAASCVIPYVMCGGLYCLRCICVSRGSLPALYIRGDRVTWKVLAEHSWSPSTTRSGSFLVLQLVLRLFG